MKNNKNLYYKIPLLIIKKNIKISYKNNYKNNKWTKMK